MCVGVNITRLNDSDLFIVGSYVELTCTSEVGVADRIEWVSGAGQVLRNGTLIQQLSLTFDPVSDSLQESEVICRLTRGGIRANQTFPITVIGMYVCMYV